MSPIREVIIDCAAKTNITTKKPTAEYAKISIRFGLAEIKLANNIYIYFLFLRVPNNKLHAI